MAATTEKDATADSPTCPSFPEFAVICSFFEKFSTTCGIPRPSFNELQEMLENTNEVTQTLIDLHVKLMRKARKTITTDKWERALAKFAHTYSQQDGWELERFGYKNSKLIVKLRLLKALLELQFDCNNRFKSEVNKLSAQELRVQPLGRDQMGLAYWCQFDPGSHLRVYREDPEEESWELVAKDRTGLVDLIDSLSSGEGQKELGLILEEENANQEAEKPVTDTGQPITNGTDANGNGGEVDGEEESGEEEEESGSGDDESEEEDEDEEEDETQQSSEGVNGVENGVKDKVSDSISVPKPTEPVSDIKETPATESTPAVTSTPVIVSTTASTSTVASSVSTPKPVSSPPVLAKISQQPAPPVLPSTTSQVSKQTHSVISTPVSQPLPASKPSVPFATATPPAPVPFASITLADSTYTSSTPTMPTNMSISFPTPSPIARVSLPTTVALPSNLTVSTSHKQRLYQPPAQVTSSVQPPAQSMPQNLSMFMPKITTAPARVPVVQNRYTMNDSSTNGLVDLSMKSDSREVRRPGSKLEEICRTKFDSPVYRDRDCKSEILKHISAKFNGVEDLSMSAAKKPRLDSEDKKLEISEEIEEPVQYVRGAGSGADCESLPPMNGDGNGDGNRPHPFTSSHSLRAKNTPYSFSDPDDYQNRQSTSRDGLRGDEDTGSDGASCSGCPPASESEEPSSPLEGAVGGVGVSGVYQDSSLQESCQALEELDMEDDLLVPEFSEVIEEDVMLFSGEGSGKENETGNPGISSDNECEVKEKDKEQSEKTLNDIVVTKSKIAEKSEENEESIDMNGPNKDKSTEQADENGEVSETELENGGSPGQVDKKDGKVKEVMLTNIIEACLDHNRDTSINNTSELDKQMGSKYNDLFSAKNLGSTRKGNAAKATAEKAKNKENLKESKNKNYEKEDEKSESKSQKDSLPDEDSEQSKDVEETSNKEDKSEQDDLAKQTRGRKSRTNSQNSDEIQVPQKIRKTLEDKPPSVSSRRSTRSSSIQSTTSVDNETEKPTSKTSNKKGAAKKPQDKNSKAPEESENEEPLDDKQSNEKSEVTEDKLKSAGKRKRTAERRISKSEEESTEQEKDDEEEDEAGGKRPRLRGKMKRTRPKGIKIADPDSSDDERSVEKDKDNVDQKKSLKQENKNKKISKPTKPEELKKDSIAKKEADKTDEESDEEDSKPEKEDSKNNKMQSKGKTSKEDSSTKSKENDKLDKTETVGKKDVKKEDVIKDVKKEDDTKGVKKEGGSKDVKKEGVSKDVKKEGGSKDVKQEGGSKEIKKEDEEDEESEEEEIPERVLRGGRTTRASMKATNNEQEKNKNKSAVQKGKNVKNNKDTKNKTENPQAKSNQNKNSTPPKGKANTKSKAKSKPSPKKGKSTPQVTKKPEPKSKSTTNTPNNVLKNNKTKAKMDKSVITIEDSTDDETAIKKENEIKSEKDEDVEIKEEDVEVKKEDVEVKKEDEDTKPKPKGRPKNKQLSRVSSADDPENESSKDTDDTKSGKKSDSEDKSEKTTDSEVKKVRPRGRPRKPPKSERTKEERDSDEDDKKSAKKKRSFLMGLTERDLKFSESLNDEDAGGRMRQSRRIAQQKIKEEAERRAIEEATLFSMKEMGKSKKKKDKSEDKLNKKKKKKESSEHEDEPFPEPATDDKKKKRKKKKKDRLKYNIDKPWLSSSCSSSENEQEEEDHFEYDYEEEYNNPGKDVSDHEFSPESDLEKDADYVPVRRARTACKKKDKEVKAGEEAEKVEEEKGDKEKAVEEDDYSCEKCGQADHPEWILLCDTCDKGYHASCLRPPLMLIPEGDWFCPPCQHAVLVTNLKQTLRTFEKSSKRRDNEELRRKRLAYVGISLANVLPDGGGNYSWKKSKKSKGKGEREDKDNRKSVSGDSSSEESSSSSSSYYEDEDEPVYQLRQRRSAGQANYRFNEYDDLINSAIQDDMDANQIAPVVSRGKDIGNIINAEEGEENVTAEAPAEGEIPKENPEAENEDSGNYKPPPMAKRPAFHLGRKKPKKLNNLDINSDDQDSDEDFKGSSSEEEEESDNLGSDESGSWRGGRRQPLRRSGRARQSRIDREFINDDDSSDEPRKKKSKRMWQESESESSDGSWGRRKRKPQIRAAVRPKRSGRKGRRGGFRKKPRKFLDSDSDVPRRARVKKPKVKYSPIIDDEDMGRKTRGKKINYLEVIGTDSDDDTKGYQKVKKKASDDDDDFTLDNEEIEEELPPPPPPPPPPAPVHKEIKKTNRIESDESEEDEEEENEDEEEENEDEEEENDEEEEEDDEEEDEGEPKAVKETEKSIGNPTSTQGSVIKSTDQLEGGVIKQTEKVEPLKLQVPEANRVPEVKVADKIVEPKTLVKPNVPEKKNLEKVEDEEEEEDEEDSEEDEEEEEEGEEEGEEEEEEEEEDEAGEEEEEDEEGEEPAKPTVAEKKKEDEPPVLNIRVVPPQKLLAEPTLPVAPVVGKGLPQESVIRGMLQPTHFRPSNHQVPIHRVPNSSHPPQQRPRFVYGQQPPIPPQGFQPPPAAFYSPSQPGYQPPPPLQPVQPAQDDDYTDYPQPIGPLPEHTTRYPNPGVAGQTGDGEFGGLVSYFSSQHEDDLET